MNAQLIPVAFASVFVAGCLAIQLLQRWSEHVSAGLACIFVVVVLLLVLEILAEHMPRQYAAAPTTPMRSAHVSYGASSFNQNGPTQMRASPSYKVPTVFRD